jgi:hypothetical protein
VASAPLTSTRTSSSRTLSCRRRISGTSESGAPLQEDSVAIYRLVRRASGWVIADVK